MRHLASWLLAAALLGAAPAVAQDDPHSGETWGDPETAADPADRLTIAGRFRDLRGRVGTRFVDTPLGAHVDEHVDVALEYRLYQFLDDGPPQDSRRTRHEGRLEVEYENELREDLVLFVELRVWVDDDDYATGGIENLEDDEPRRHILDVTEAYVDWFADDFDLRLGKQIVKWGKADVFNPTDQINPTDFSTLLDDEPIGVVAGKLNYYFDDWGLEMVVVPTFVPSRFSPRGTRFDLVPQTLPLPLLSPRERPNTLDEVQYGLRANTTLEGWDFSASWYDGVNHFPGTVIVPSATFPFMAFEPVYHRRRMLGGDFATTFDQLGLHGEAAWFRSDGHWQDEYYQYVIGIDYKWTNVFRDHDIFAIVEYAGEHVITQQRKGLTAGALERAFANSLAWNIDYDVTEFLTYTVRGVYNFDGRDNFFIEPQVEHEVTDHFTITAGFDIIQGGGQTLFGRLRENDQFYLKARYTF